MSPKGLHLAPRPEWSVWPPQELQHALDAVDCELIALDPRPVDFVRIRSCPS